MEEAMVLNFRHTIVSVAILAFLGASNCALAQTKVVVGQTSQTAVSWPEYIAQEQGFFKQEGIEARNELVGSVASIAQQVVGGSLDLGFTTFDIVVQAVESGGAPISLIGSTTIKYPYTMMSAKNVKTAADLKGKKVILPVPKNDIANFFQAWAEENGLKEGDVDRVYDGASGNRYAALVAGAASAAAVTAPLNFAAEAAGYNKLIDFGSYVKGYGFIAIIARKDWLAKNRPTAEAYLRALSKGVDWFYTPANRAAAIQILMRATKQERAIAEKTYDWYNELQPFSRGLTVPDADFNNVLKGYQERGVVKSQTANKAKFVDLSFLK
jgi:NitT/TauT family transport system substrate-binding protein